MQDIEGDCGRLLETGLFSRARPTTQLPMATQAPDFVRDKDGHLNPVIPLNQVRDPSFFSFLPMQARTGIPSHQIWSPPVWD